LAGRRPAARQRSRANRSTRWCAALGRFGQPYVVVAGQGEARVRSAWRAVRRAHALPASLAAGDDDAAIAAWHTRCERCGDPDCERHLLPRPLAAD
jgi:hypothetical protein